MLSKVPQALGPQDDVLLQEENWCGQWGFVYMVWTLRSFCEDWFQSWVMSSQDRLLLVYCSFRLETHRAHSPRRRLCSLFSKLALCVLEGRPM